MQKENKRFLQQKYNSVLNVSEENNFKNLKVRILRGILRYIITLGLYADKHLFLTSEGKCF